MSDVACYCYKIAHFGDKQQSLTPYDVVLLLLIFNKMRNHLPVRSPWVHFRYFAWFVLRLWVVNTFQKSYYCFFLKFSVFYFRRWSFVLFFLPLYYLTFSNYRLLITRLVSSNISYARTPLKYVRVAKWLLTKHKRWHQQCKKQNI
jgi:hypothetical protein